jgi:hypothetical protein
MLKANMAFRAGPAGTQSALVRGGLAHGWKHLLVSSNRGDSP